MRSPSSPKRELPQGRKQHTILLLHGILGQRIAYWNMMKKYLRSDRYHFREVRFPFFGFGDLRKSAVHLAKAVDEILANSPEETDEGRIDIVAHSAGGLVARYYIKFLGGDHTVHSLVTLATPHHGTWTGALFPFATVARQTLPRSRFLKDLNNDVETHGRVHYTSIFSSTDGVILPPSSARLEGARNVEAPYLTHWGFLWRPSVYREIRQAIDHARGTFLVRDRTSRPAKAFTS